MTAARQTQLRFLLVGGINTLIDFGLLLGLVHLGTPTLIANTISTGLAFCVSFFANRSYTFKATSGSLPRQMGLFVAVTLFGLWVLQPIVIWAVSPLLTTWFGSWVGDTGVLLLAKVAATCITLVWNYVLYARVVFRG